jgi:lipopolysaccharide export system permease protein
MKGEREMSICEMQKEYDRATSRVHQAEFDSIRTAWRMADTTSSKHTPEPKMTAAPKGGGIGAVYCNLVQNYLKKYRTMFKVKEAHAADLRSYLALVPHQDTTKLPARKIPAVPPQRPSSVFVMVGGQYVKVPIDKIPAGATFPGSTPGPAPSPSAARPSTPPPVVNNAVPTPQPNAAPAQAVPATPNAQQPASVALPYSIELNDVRMRIDQARHEHNRYGVEIQKKFSLAAACIVLVLVGAPLALRFPSGGVGLVFGVSFLVFSIYYIGLIGGESLANKGIISPFWAMWADNIIFSVVGLLLMTRMGHEGVTSRGGGLGEWFDSVRMRFGGRAARAEIATAAHTPS